jgi:hypothetical protein
MTRFALWLIGVTARPSEREWIVGDTLEAVAERRDTAGTAAARWLLGEAGRALRHAPRHRFTQHRVTHRRRAWP